MKTTQKVLWAGLVSFALLALPAGQSRAQQDSGPLAKQLIGTWIVVAVVVERPDGSRFDSYGPDPKGLLIFDATGRYVSAVMRSGRPKFAANTRIGGTAEENQAALEGIQVHLGTYTVNEAERTVTLHVEGAAYPNLEGTDQKRTVILAGDELKWSFPGTSGRGIAHNVWRRAK
jgi:hypothetical protein